MPPVDDCESIPCVGHLMMELVGFGMQGTPSVLPVFTCQGQQMFSLVR